MGVERPVVPVCVQLRDRVLSRPFLHHDPIDGDLQPGAIPPESAVHEHRPGNGLDLLEKFLHLRRLDLPRTRWNVNVLQAGPLDDFLFIGHGVVAQVDDRAHAALAERVDSGFAGLRAAIDGMGWILDDGEIIDAVYALGDAFAPGQKQCREDDGKEQATSHAS